MTASSRRTAAFSNAHRSLVLERPPPCVPWVELKTQQRRFNDFRRSSLSMMNDGIHDILQCSHHSSNMLIAAQESAAATSFEPQLNVPAFGSFVFIFVVFSILRFRVNAINDAAERRKDALRSLREIKSKQLELEASDTEAEMAILEYEKALEEEENLRTIVPGVRIRAPDSARQSKEDLRAIQQFLGDETKTKMGLNEKEESEESPAGFPPLVLLLLLVFIGGSQTFLLVLLSLDNTPSLH